MISLERKHMVFLINSFLLFDVCFRLDLTHELSFNGHNTALEFSPNLSQ